MTDCQKNWQRDVGYIASLCEPYQQLKLEFLK